MFEKLILFFILSYKINCQTTTNIPPTTPTLVYNNCTLNDNKLYVTAYNNSCYYFSNSEERMTWHDANEACQRTGAQLLSIHDRQFNQLIANLGRKLFPSDNKTQYWIGFNSLAQRGIYKWTDGSAYDYGNYPYPGSSPAVIPTLPPSTYNIYTKGRCNYYYLWSIYNAQNQSYDNYGYWYFDDCNNVHQYICAKSVSPTTSSPTVTTPVPKGNCDDGWSQFDDRKCIKYLNTSLSYSSSQERCQQLNGDLIAIHSLKEQSFVNALIAGLQSPYIGLQYHSVAQRWVWSDQNKVDYANWGNFMQPNDYGCAVIATSEVQTGKWNYSACNASHPVICEKSKNTSITSPPLNPFPNCTLFPGFDNFIQYQNSCYYMSDANKTWYSAEAECELLFSSHLVSIITGFEHSFLTFYALEYSLNDAFWIGLFAKDEDANNTQVFEWSDTSPVYDTYWDEDEPRVNQKNQRRCAYQLNDVWKTDDCEVNRRFLCKKSNDKPIETDSNLVGSCPHSNSVVDPKQAWIDLDKRSKNCYWFSVDLSNSVGRETWFEAAYHCKQRNATLVSFHSMHDMLLLKNKIIATNISTWTGLSQTSEGEYVWDDGSAVDFTNWYTPSGDHSQTTDTCVSIRSQDLKWVKSVCTTTNSVFNYYICQIPKIYLTNETIASTTTILPNTIGSKAEKPKSKKLSNAAKAGIVVSVFLVICAATGGAIFTMIKYNISCPSLPSFGSIRNARRKRRTQ